MYASEIPQKHSTICARSFEMGEPAPHNRHPQNLAANPNYTWCDLQFHTRRTKFRENL